jgi:hypothetical protein
VPDKPMIKVQYYLKTGRRLNLKKPSRYTEKIQLYKLFYRDPKIKFCSDKIKVREFVKNKGYEDILIPILALQDSIFKIDFKNLPKSFVLKSNAASGANIIVAKKTKNLIKIWIKFFILKFISYEKSGREWGYYGTQEKVYVEQMLERDLDGDIPDYKFFCFNGRVEVLYIMQDYIDNHNQGKCSFFDRDFNLINATRSEYAPITKKVVAPKNFEYMIKIAEDLSKDFPHVRVDLYNISGKIFFGEMTFYPASGYSKFTPDEFDYDLGAKFNWE